MMTSGMYQNAGEFAWRVGLPAKSGVGGGIVAIVPQEMAIAVWSRSSMRRELAGRDCFTGKTHSKAGGGRCSDGANRKPVCPPAAFHFSLPFSPRREERQYCYDKGAEVIDQHAADFIARRLAAARIPNDGKQTPMRGHPVFIAQHATATCCRGCLESGTHPARARLSDEEQRYVVQVIHHWLVIQMNSPDRGRP
jgi:hypothetical protein